MNNSLTQPVVFQPAVARGLQRGINQIANAVRPTLGASPRFVAFDRGLPGSVPEFLDDAGLIARRITELADRDADVGAMLIRHVLWRQHEQFGDGTATAALLMQAVFNRGACYVAAGGDAMRLRHVLTRGVELAIAELQTMIVLPSQPEQLAQIAETICGDPPLAHLLGEIFEIIGADGDLEIRSGHGRELERAYVEGSLWESTILSRYMLTEQYGTRCELEHPAILLSDFDVRDPQELVPALEQALRADLRTLVVVAHSMSDAALGLLLAQPADRMRIIAVKFSAGTTNEAAVLEDLARLTGGQPLLQAAGDSLRMLTPQHFGRAQRAWADSARFGIVAGAGDPRVLRTHIAALRACHRQSDDIETRRAIQKRIATLTGGTAILTVGGWSEQEIAQRKARATRASGVLRMVLDSGVLPGGGAALLGCRPALRRQLASTIDVDERAAYQILIEALEVPARTLICNADYAVATTMAAIDHAGAGYSLDTNSGEIAAMANIGILDGAAAQVGALRGAVTSAALALTIDICVHPAHRSQALMQP